MRLAPTDFKLDEYQLPDGRCLYGELEIEIDCVDGSPYIYAMDLGFRDEDGVDIGSCYYSPRLEKNQPEASEIRNMLFRDRKLMDLIYDACADAASE